MRGLSPRVRGNRQRCHGREARGGSIPACAGEPCGLGSAGSSTGVYPRVCGGTRRRHCQRAWPWGLSPRVRGNPSGRGWRRAHRGSIPRVRGNLLPILRTRESGGSIPACAGEPLTSSRTPSPCWVYPRVCGGTFASRVHTTSMPGLSPRVRGNLIPATRSATLEGSIPACAGEPRRHRASIEAGRVYPRVCGGTCTLATSSARVRGLSPRVRGNHVSIVSPFLECGSIPACAGEPLRRPASRGTCQVYPRVCGGTEIALPYAPAFVGLSPRVRGNPFGRDRDVAGLGSIPACAGEPVRPRSRRCWSRVYPRVCGGTGRRVGPLALGEGLSPRVRGNHPRLAAAARPDGSIPACAGEPFVVDGQNRSVRVYPRVCGGTWHANPDPRYRPGLSPRVRGNRPRRRNGRAEAGSIPACAGEPSPAACACPSPGVYPRVCGGTQNKTCASFWISGLSPRVRGTAAAAPQAGMQTGLSPRVRGNHWCERKPGEGWGSIPACAGNPLIIRDDSDTIGSIPACAGEPWRRSSARSWRRVYPRVCGGTRHSRFLQRLYPGLSPRVRGNRCSPPRARACRGSIPACAGNPLGKGERLTLQGSIPACAGEP